MRNRLQGVKIENFPVNFPENREIFSGDRFAHDCSHHQAFQELSRIAVCHSDKLVIIHSDKSAGFVRVARRFWAPEISCLRVRFA
jgi:hypothetical protein